MPHLDKITIRKAIISDAQGIALVHIKGWQESYKGIINQDYLDSLTNDLEKKTKGWQKIISKCNSEELQLVALYNKEVIGFSTAGPTKESTEAKGEIYTIYLLDQFKGLGVGKKLWDKVVEHLVTKKLIPFDVVMLEANISARKFYERQGCILIRSEFGNVGGKEYKEVRYRG